MEYPTTKLFTQRLKFVKWAEGLGISGIFHKSQLVGLKFRVKIEKPDTDKIMRACVLIQKRLEEAQALAKKYIQTSELPPASTEIVEVDTIPEAVQEPQTIIRTICDRRFESGRLGVYMRRASWDLVGHKQSKKMVDELDRLINDLIVIVPGLIKYVDEQSRVDAQAFVPLRPEQLQHIAVAAAENNFDLPFAEVLQTAIAQAASSSSATASKVQKLNSNLRALCHLFFLEEHLQINQSPQETLISCKYWKNTIRFGPMVMLSARERGATLD